MGEIMKRESKVVNSNSQIQNLKDDKFTALDKEIQSLDHRIANNKKMMFFALETHIATIALFFVLLFSSFTFYYTSNGRVLWNVIFIYWIINAILAIPVQLIWATKQRNINDVILKSYAEYTDNKFETVFRDISPGIIGPMNYWLLRKYARNHFIFWGIAFCWAYLIPPIILGLIYAGFMAVMDEDEYNKIRNKKYERYNYQYYINQLENQKKEIDALKAKSQKDETEYKINKGEIQRKTNTDL